VSYGIGLQIWKDILKWWEKINELRSDLGFASLVVRNLEKGSLNWCVHFDVMKKGDLKMSYTGHGHGRKDEGLESRNMSWKQTVAHCRLWDGIDRDLHEMDWDGRWTRKTMKNTIEEEEDEKKNTDNNTEDHTFTLIFRRVSCETYVECNSFIQNYCVFGVRPSSRSPIILSIIHHRQNTLEFYSFIFITRSWETDF
jgi:hypothetical protein